MAIPTPTIPSSIPTVSAVALKPTKNNKSFYIYSGEITVDSNETTMLSVNDIGKRDVLLCLEATTQETNDLNMYIKVKSNGEVVFAENRKRMAWSANEIKVILPADTSLEVTIEQESGSSTWTVAGYGYYLEHM